jgi:hypothetical protein
MKMNDCGAGLDGENDLDRLVQSAQQRPSSDPPWIDISSDTHSPPAVEKADELGCAGGTDPYS